MTVQSLKLSRIVVWIFYSVSISMLAVASSIRMILLFFNTARAIHTNYFSPALRLSPPSTIRVPSPWSRWSKLAKLHLWSASVISLSVCFPRGSMFYLSVPSKRVGSCMIIVMDSLNYCKLTVQIFTESIKMHPPIASRILNKVIVIVDLPAPTNIEY
jgi:hypothetical protein